MKDEKKYFKTIDTKLGDGKNLKLVGCNHGTPQTSGDFFERQEFYKEVCDWADALILEQSAYCEFYDSPFFHNISQSAYNKNKKVYIIDPNNERAREMHERLERKFGQAEEIDQMRLKEGNKGRVSRQRYKTKHPKGNEIEYHNNMKENWWKISWGVDDWRNVVSAKLLAEKIPQLKIENILSIYGGGHTRPIDFYLRNPELRETKFQQYGRFNETSDQGIREFTPRQDLCPEKEFCWEKNLIMVEPKIIKIRWMQ